MDDETRKQMNVEETFAALDRIIGKLEKGDGSLEDSWDTSPEAAGDSSENAYIELHLEFILHTLVVHPTCSTPTTDHCSYARPLNTRLVASQFKPVCIILLVHLHILGHQRERSVRQSRRPAPPSVSPATCLHRRGSKRT